VSPGGEAAARAPDFAAAAVITPFPAPMQQPPSRYLIALGSNVPHPRHGPPPKVLRAALVALGMCGLPVIAAAPIVASAPLGPSRRRYANTAAVIETRLPPLALLDRLQAIEAAFGRNRRGQRWRARTLDLDIVLWTGGAFDHARLTVPHRAYTQRAFVLGPATRVAADWRDPATCLCVKHAHARLTRRARLPKAPTPQPRAPGP
jgi:2-amino-4-hydroxy-6-hydroxymethyldihydropteridine diphosphokinase